MKERPILFSAPMVRAILDGSKTQTRRVVKPQPSSCGHFGFDDKQRLQVPAWDGLWLLPCPYGQPGDRLWVREAFAHIYRDNSKPDDRDRRDDDVAYKADHAGLDEYVYGSWKPSIHMPRWASRITLEVTGVRVERLRDISEADAIAEGAPPSHPSIDRISREFGFADFPRSWFGQLWESINGPSSWAANPWVWVIEFKRVEGNKS